MERESVSGKSTDSTSVQNKYTYILVTLIAQKKCFDNNEDNMTQ